MYTARGGLSAKLVFKPVEIHYIGFTATQKQHRFLTPLRTPQI